LSHINRLVLNFPGFETTDAVHQIERLSAGGQKTAKLWSFDLHASKIASKGQSHKTSIEYDSSSEKWTAHTDYKHFSWTDIIDKYPMLMMIVFAIFSWFLMHYTIGQYGMHWVMTALPAFVLFLILCRFPGDMAYLNLSINDWGFARDLVTLSNPDIVKRNALFADHLIKEISSSKHDEIIIVGHSFGSVWAVSALAIALEKKPNLLKGKRVTFFALGSSLLKIALVKKAKYFDKFVKQVLSESNIVWHEVQTKTDFISFYKTEPFAPMKKSMYLAHRQYILYHDKRVHHDFQLRVFGPFYADELARDAYLYENNDLIPEQMEA